jgi:hypothetical protein
MHEGKKAGKAGRQGKARQGKVGPFDCIVSIPTAVEERIEEKNKRK